MFLYLCRALALFLSLATPQAFGMELELVLLPGSVRVRQEGPLPDAPLDLAAAQGEYESFQVVVTPRDGLLRKGKASISPFSKATGEAAPGITAALYRAAYVPVRYSAPRAVEAPGLVADPLIPFVNPYTGETVYEPGWRDAERIGPRFGAANFEVWPDWHQPLWVDVHVAPGTPAGRYTAKLRVSADGAEAEVPVTLEVWDFALPEGPVHENSFGGLGSVANYHKLQQDSPEFQVLEARYAEAMVRHGLNPPFPAALRPTVGEDGTADFSSVDAALREFVDRHHVTNFQVPHVPYGDPAGENRAKALNFFRSWYEYLASKGWAERAYHYMYDEPNDQEAYERVRALGAVVQEAAPELRRLVVEQTYTNNAAWGTLDAAIDIWCPLFSFIDEQDVQRVLNQGDDVWSYTALIQTAPDYHPQYEAVKNDLPPFWQLDFPVLSYRIAPWINRRYGITGLLYWSAVHWENPPRNPWDDPGFRVRWNGEGFLFYPGSEAGIEGPIASIRLKNLRDGLDDYKYFAVLESRGGGEEVEAIVREAVPTWGSWNQDPEALARLRRKLAVAILAR